MNRSKYNLSGLFAPLKAMGEVFNTPLRKHFNPEYDFGFQGLYDGTEVRFRYRENNTFTGLTAFYPADTLAWKDGIDYHDRFVAETENMVFDHFEKYADIIEDSNRSLVLDIRYKDAGYFSFVVEDTHIVRIDPNVKYSHILDKCYGAIGGNSNVHGITTTALKVYGDFMDVVVNLKTRAAKICPALSITVTGNGESTAFGVPFVGIPIPYIYERPDQSVAAQMSIEGQHLLSQLRRTTVAIIESILRLTDAGTTSTELTVTLAVAHTPAVVFDIRFDDGNANVIKREWLPMKDVADTIGLL